MATKWSDILVSTIITASAKRLKNIIFATGKVFGVLASLFPVPGPDADARIAAALLDLASAFDILDGLIVEIGVQTVAQLPIPTAWSTRVIRGDTAARIALLAMADGIQTASRGLDTPAENLRTAVLIKHWRRLIADTWDLAVGEYIRALGRYIRLLFKFGVLKAISAAITVADLALKTIMSAAGIIIAIAVLDSIQTQFEKAFLEQRNPRKKMALKAGGSISRRIGSNPP